MPIGDLYPNDILSQYLMGPNQPDPSMQPALPVQSQALPSPAPSPMMSSLTGNLQQTNPQEQGINIDGWKPHHSTTLGKIADVGLALLGLPILPFANKAKRQNLQEAIEGFTVDPLNSIRKLSKIPGMEDKAWKLFEDYQTIHRNDDTDAEKLRYYKGMNEDRARGVLSSYLGAIGRPANKDPEGTYQKLLPTLRNFVNQRGLPAELLPDKWDPDLAQAVTISGIKPEDQARNEEMSNYHRQSIGIRMDDAITSREYKGARLQQLGQHEQAYEHHNTEMENISRSKSKGVKTYKMTKYGPAEVSPDGNSMLVQIGNVQHVYARTGPDTWRYVKAKPVPLKEQMPDPNADDEDN